jgi:rod shape-determining protein MreD
VARGTFYLLILWTVAGLLVRASAERTIGLFGVVPDLLTLVVIYWALAGGGMAGVLAGFVVGLVADVDLGRNLGLTAGALAAVGYVAGNIGSSLHRERPPAQFVVLFVATTLVLALRTLFAAHGDPAAWVAMIPAHVLLRAVYTALLGPLVYLIARILGAPDFLAHGATSAES